MQPGRARLFFLLFAVASTSSGLAQSRRPPADTDLSSSSGSARTYSIRGTVRLASSDGTGAHNNKKFAEAVLLRRGLDMDRNDWHGRYELARALLGLDRLDAAETSGQEACTRRSDFPAVHLLLAEVHQRKHDYPALLNDLDEYLKLEPDGPISTRARELRDELRRGLEGARNAPAQNPRQP